MSFSSLTLAVLTVLLSVLPSVSAALSPELRDHPISSGVLPQYLDGDNWMVISQDESISAVGHVPGDLVTDLQQAGVIKDPLYELGFKGTLWDTQNFTYSVNFNVNADVAAAPIIQLVFDGVKMACDITLNNVYLGATTDQFVRYTFDVTDIVQRGGGANTLTLNFGRMTDHRNDEGRFMACSGAWDWAPYSTLETAQQSKVLTKGVYKSVYLLGVSSATIDSVAPLVFYNGQYPTTPLTDATAGPWTVSVRVYLSVSQRATSPVTGQLQVVGAWNPTAPITIPVSVSPGAQSVRSTVNVTIPVGGVSLWWPNGMGAHTLYQLNVTFTPSSSTLPVVTASRRLGFRQFTLVTGNDTIPSTLAGVDGSGAYTMRFKVNGANVWARGANWIPPEVLEGRQTPEAYRLMVNAGRDAGYNTFRVWGGGIYNPEVWLDACDEAGILVYQDYMYGRPWFGGNSGVPANTTTQEAEIRQQTRRHATHPSIALWDSSNESGGHGLYASFVMALAAEEDPSRPLWPACPSTGWVSGVDRLTSLPNGSPLGLQPHATAPKSAPSNATEVATMQRRLQPSGATCNANPGDIEVHGPYQHGEGFATVNSQAALQPFAANIPPNLDAAHVLGTNCRGTFASEFGGSVPSSFESMTATLDPTHWALHAAPMTERNYASDNFLTVYFPIAWPKEFNATGNAATFRKHLYLAQMGQALLLKSDISTRRSRNSWGTVVWQHGEVWPTGGWGSLEYSTGSNLTTGQVIGGRWKPLMYFYKSFLFTDTFVACSADARCIVRNDNALAAFAGTLQLSVLHLATGSVSPLYSLAVSLPRGAAAATWTCASSTGSPYSNNCPRWSALLPATGCAASGADCILQMSLTPTGVSAPTYSSFELFVPPKNMTLPKATVSAVVGTPWPNATGVPITVTATGGTALFVGLVTQAQGRFSDNYFILPPSQREIVFLAYGSLDVATLTNTLRVEHVAGYF